MVQLTGPEIRLMIAAFKCFKTQPEIDFRKLAEEMEYVNIRSASNAWRTLKKKIIASAPAVEESEDGEDAEAEAEIEAENGAPSRAGAKKGKGKGKAGKGVNATPKKTKKTNQKANKEVAEEEKGDVVEE